MCHEWIDVLPRKLWLSVNVDMIIGGLMFQMGLPKSTMS